ncbi:MAG: 50S ribosomal protein L4 [Bacteroidales bacterium]|jgi:large subunit ribosomal protein L4|nr:50S ribosomal protein L4 [Bacteroidales bacterium]MDD2687062.1 50S ribosomal protein L4 [Bacteroidales bacterium]MDD3330674.1 50S ribosomal protein L4 [Bacteroidales bacterium]MDD3691541.1 50S ribosomal protein L4 [Bacteroidales bacterium]MDD4045001.1 50S ribosomal protein L4 [Bacteroidales bacterium]
MELKVINIEGKETGRTVSLNEEVFGIEPNTHVMWLDVKQYLANQRQGTHASKEKSLLSGSTRKLRKQKGGGGARFGSIKSPLLRGGARIFGPQPRDYSFKLNKKVKRLARISALSQKAKENNITVLEGFDLETPKTSGYLDIIKKLNLLDKKTLLVLNESNKNIYLSSRNLRKAKVVSVYDLNTYDILNAQNVIISEPAASKFDEFLKINE